MRQKPTRRAQEEAYNRFVRSLKRSAWREVLRGGAMGETVSSLSSSIEDVVFDVLNECETFQTEAE